MRKKNSYKSQWCVLSFIPSPPPTPYKELRTSWWCVVVTMAHVWLPPLSHFLELLLIKLKLEYFLLDLSPDRVVLFSSLLLENVWSISKLLSGFYWWSSNMYNYLNLFTPYTFYFKNIQIWKLYGENKWLSSHLFLPPHPPLHINPLMCG